MKLEDAWALVSSIHAHPESAGSVEEVTRRVVRDIAGRPVEFSELRRVKARRGVALSVSGGVSKKASKGIEDKRGRSKAISGAATGRSKAAAGRSKAATASKAISGAISDAGTREGREATFPCIEWCDSE